MNRRDFLLLMTGAANESSRAIVRRLFERQRNQEIYKLLTWKPRKVQRKPRKFGDFSSN